MLKSIRIKSGQGDYDVEFSENFKDFNLLSNLSNQDYFVLVDAKVWNIYSHELTQLSGLPIYIVDAVEESKTLDGVGDFSKWLISNGASKSSVILAIGGGIIQDIATFTAHVFKRGICWEYIPTTLLSQSDSCIGAKCGINVLPYKNQLGVMQSPQKVWIVSEFLNSLDDETFKSGFGEILKLSLTPPNSFYQEFKADLNKQGLDKSNVLVWIQASLRAKQAIIEIDEYEKDLRRILNYGHSFGHALESVSRNSVSHGYGVLFGIDLINYLSVHWGLLDKDMAEAIRSTIKDNFKLDFLPEKLTSTQLIEALRTDKKISAGKIHFAILDSSWNLRTEARNIDDELTNLVAKYLEDECIFTSS